MKNLNQCLWSNVIFGKNATEIREKLHALKLTTIAQPPLSHIPVLPIPSLVHWSIFGRDGTSVTL